MLILLLYYIFCLIKCLSLSLPPSLTLVIVLTFDVARSFPDTLLIDLVTTSRVAALILYSQRQDEAYLQQRAAALMHPIQAQKIAVLVAGDPRIGVRVRADGIHHEEHIPVLDTPSMMVGYGNIKDRHQAMMLGEADADYLLFGKLGSDHQPQPHPRNLRLGSWWACVMEVPCLVQGGSDIEALPDLFATGAEFILVEEMIFSQPDPHAAFIQINHLLDKIAILSQKDKK